MREGGGGTPPATEDDGRDRPDRPSSAAGRRDDGLTVVRIHPTPGARVWGAFVAGDPVWPRAVTVALVVELVLLAGVPMLAPVLLVGTVGSVLVVVLLRRALVHR